MMYQCSATFGDNDYSLDVEAPNAEQADRAFQQYLYSIRHLTKDCVDRWVIDKRER